jgi:tRNA (adenine22-N1)-methyltransferase
MLEPRLLAVAQEIYSDIHLDIGSDHALLPKYLLENKFVKQIIVIEKNLRPFQNAKNTLGYLNAKILLGDGLEPLDYNVDSLSLTGMGAKLIVSILTQHPDKLPKSIILQPNDSAEPIRRWALGNFHLVNEQRVKGFWNYEVLTLEQRTSKDPSYLDLPLDTALRFGPILIKQKHPLLKEDLDNQFHRLSHLKATAKVLHDLSLVQEALEFFKNTYP